MSTLLAGITDIPRQGDANAETKRAAGRSTLE